MDLARAVIKETNGTVKYFVFGLKFNAIFN